ncbi:MAG: polysaccharide biosynthesis tyrosine autokinase [Sediminicola sp.]|tara:strand:- start:51035 stop:53422 length:2388 start_codon:yes stop_codon:yes gene_type:complete
MDNDPQDFSNSGIDLKEMVRSYTKHWKWFVLSVLICMALAYLKIRYSTPEYAIQAKIKILEDGNAAPEMAVFKELDMFSGAKNEVLDEIEVLNSRSNFIEVVKNLKLNVKILEVGNVVTREIYHDPPIKLNFMAPDSVVHQADFGFYLDVASESTFGFALDEDSPIKVYSYGKNIPTPIGDVIITPNLKTLGNYKGGKLKVSVTPISEVAQGYKKKITISNIDEFSNIVNIGLEDAIPDKAMDIVNNLVLTYNQNAIADKKEIADRTFEFINERITDIAGSLANVDENAENFKTDRGLTDIASEANINLNVGAANQQELQNARTQLNIAASMQDIVSNQEGFEVLPSNVGLSDPSISNTTAKYNELVQERNRLLKSSNEKNPIIVSLDQQLAGLKRSMQSSLNNVTNNLGLTVNSLSSQQSQINSRIYSAPRNERALRDITRQQQTTESLYLYLLQKREESQVALASTSPKSKIIDRAYNTSDSPISPRKALMMLAGMIFGLLIPFSIIYVNDLMDNKIHNKAGLEKLVKDIPVLAELPKLSRRDNKMIQKDDRSVLAESLRILRTNLDYLIKSKKTAGKNNLIYVTSSVPGEGKTFLSSNLAMIFANTDKKVLLIGADVRNPKLYNFFSGKHVDKLGKSKGSERTREVGLTEYLYDDSIGIKDIINTMLVHTNTVDVIHSGKIPPNPAELLMSARMKGLLEEVSQMYDYVIVDTAPLMVVTDTLLITEYADHIIYVTRAGVTESKVVQFPRKLKAEGKLKGLSFVVNDVKDSNLGYGGQYGYGYGKTLQKWWKF